MDKFTNHRSLVAETCASGKDTGEGATQKNWKGKEADTKKFSYILGYVTQFLVTHI